MKWSIPRIKRATELYQWHTATECSRILSLEWNEPVSHSSLRSLLHKRGVKKGYNPGNFRRGLVPWNKGKRFRAGGRSSETQFKDGSIPANSCCTGTTVIRRDKSGNKYPYIKTEAGKWVPKQRYVWEKNNGPIPGGHVIFFKDGDSMNCVIKNLECIDRATLIKRNHNRSKASETLKVRWATIRALHDYGVRTDHGWMKSKKQQTRMF